VSRRARCERASVVLPAQELLDRDVHLPDVGDHAVLLPYAAEVVVVSTTSPCPIFPTPAGPDA
jgi:hypothetical protein